MAQKAGPKFRQIWPAMFVLGVVLITPPFLLIFDRQVTVGSMPLLFAYFMFGWAASIGVILLYRHSLSRDGGAEGR